MKLEKRWKHLLKKKVALKIKGLSEYVHAAAII